MVMRGLGVMWHCGGAWVGCHVALWLYLGWVSCGPVVILGLGVMWHCGDTWVGCHVAPRRVKMFFLCVSLASSVIGQWTQIWSTIDWLIHVEQVALFNIPSNFSCRHILQLQFVTAFLCFSDSLSSEVLPVPFLCWSDISRILWNAMVRCIDKYPPLFPVLS